MPEGEGPDKKPPGNILREITLITLVVSITFLACKIVTASQINSGDTLAGIISLMVIIKDTINRP